MTISGIASEAFSLIVDGEPGDGAIGVSMTPNRLIDRADEVAPILSAIANGKRLAIMCHLLGGELTVGEIAEKVDLSQSALSQHLAKLRALDLVATRRSRQMVYYSCRSHRVRQILGMLDTLFSQPEPHRDAAQR